MIMNYHYQLLVIYYDNYLKSKLSNLIFNSLSLVAFKTELISFETLVLATAAAAIYFKNNFTLFQDK